VDWSYQLLTSHEGLLLDRLSVFAGSFDLAAVEAICGTPPLHRVEVFEVLASLVDKSMVTADRGAERTRYRLLETLRQFAAEHVTESHDRNELRQRHLTHYIEVAREADRLWASPRQLTANAIFEWDWDNLRAAHSWAVTTADVHAADLIVATTGHHASACGRHEHGDWAKRTLDLESAGRHPACATFRWAHLASVAAGDNEAAITVLERGIRAAPGPDHPDTVGCWVGLIMTNVASGRDRAAVEPAQHLALLEPTFSDPVDRWHAVQGLVENALANDPGSMPGLVDRLAEQAGQIGGPSLLSETARYRALCALYAQEPRDAERAFIAASEGIVLARTVRDLFCEGSNLSALVFAAVALNRPDTAQICRDAITWLYDLRYWQLLWLVMDTTPRFFVAAGSVHEASVLYGHLEAHHPPFGIPAARRARQRGLDRVRQLADFELLMAQGADMDRDELVAYTFERLERAPAPQIEPA
jgi:hypothetical protein